MLSVKTLEKLISDKKYGIAEINPGIVFVIGAKDCRKDILASFIRDMASFDFFAGEIRSTMDIERLVCEISDKKIIATLQAKDISRALERIKTLSEDDSIFENFPIVFERNSMADRYKTIKRNTKAIISISARYYIPGVSFQVLPNPFFS